MTDIKPCPFCACVPTEWDLSQGTPDKEGIPTYVSCGECGACGPWVYIPDNNDDSLAIDEWNRRAR